MKESSSGLSLEPGSHDEDDNASGMANTCDLEKANKRKKNRKTKAVTTLPKHDRSKNKTSNRRHERELARQARLLDRCTRSLYSKAIKRQSGKDKNGATTSSRDSTILVQV